MFLYIHTCIYLYVELDLSYNQLTKLPSEISEILLLTHLNVSHNKLTSLPDSLSLLIELTQLDISHNQLNTCCELPPLQVLNVSYNCLEGLPFSPPLMTTIKDIDVSHNNIVSFDKEELLSNCPWLESVDLRNNPLDNELHSQLTFVVRIKIILED